MEKIFELGVQRYVAAIPATPLNVYDHIVLVANTLIDIVRFLVLSIPSVIESLIFLFVPRPKKDVTGQVVLITGAGNGIGKAMALRLAAIKCKIAVVDIERDAAKQTVAEIIKNNGTAVAYCMDITDNNAVEQLRIKIENDLGAVDILINNAALMPLMSLREGSHQEVRRIVDVNITANYIMTRVFLKEMERRGSGHIVNMSSLAALYPLSGAILYASSKFALLGFSESLSEELRQDGFGDSIHVTSAHPYFVATRADLMKILKTARYPAISPEQCADGIIGGILRNQLHVIVPTHNRFAIELFRFLPYKVQHLARDILNKENQMYKISKALRNANVKSEN